jgi:hypothetical protein
MVPCVLDRLSPVPYGAELTGRSSAVFAGPWLLSHIITSCEHAVLYGVIEECLE